MPSFVIEMPAAPGPVLSVPRILRSLRSITVTRSSGTSFVGSAGSIFDEEAISAIDSSGVIATESGGPTTLPGTFDTVPTTLTGSAPRSMIVTVSGGGLGRLRLTPFSWTIL